MLLNFMVGDERMQQEVDFNALVADVKRQVHGARLIGHTVTWVWSGRRLHDDQTLAAAGVRVNDTVHCVFRAQADQHAQQQAQQAQGQQPGGGAPQWQAAANGGLAAAAAAAAAWQERLGVQADTPPAYLALAALLSSLLGLLWGVAVIFGRLYFSEIAFLLLVLLTAACVALIHGMLFARNDNQQQQQQGQQPGQAAAAGAPAGGRPHQA